jgi:hypothetical protein
MEKAKARRRRTGRIPDRQQDELLGEASPGEIDGRRSRGGDREAMSEGEKEAMLEAREMEEGGAELGKRAQRWGQGWEVEPGESRSKLRVSAEENAEDEALGKDTGQCSQRGCGDASTGGPEEEARQKAKQTSGRQSSIQVGFKSEIAQYLFAASVSTL